MVALFPESEVDEVDRFNYQHMKIVVTGGAGFIGANLCRRLATRLGDGTQVVAVDDLSTGFAHNLEGVRGVKLAVGSILDSDLLDRSFAGASGVVHLAARPSVPRSLEDPLRSHLINATGTVEVLEAVRRAGGPYVVVASSSSVYGANQTLPKHEGLAQAPMSPYAASKLATEAYALAFAHSFGLDVLALRFFNVFGPLQAAGHAYAAVVPAFISAGLNRQPLQVYGDGEQTRDFTFVDSVTAVIIEALTGRVTSPGPVNLAFGARVSLLSLISNLEQLLGRPLRVEHLAPRTGDVRHSQADQTLLRSLFPAIEPVALAAGLSATIKWFESQAN
jgi:UDP-glucose 4-epimerase